MKMLFIIVFVWMVARLSVFGAQPVAPSGLSVNVEGVNLFTLSWTDNSTDETEFEVQRRQAQTVESFQTVLIVQVDDGSETGPVSTTYYIGPAELPPSQQEFRVRAVKQGDPGVPGSSNVVQVNVPAAVFGAPTGLTGEAGDGSVAIAWVDNANCEVAFDVEHLIGTPGTFGRLGKTFVNQTEGITITGLQPSTTYQYRVRAIRGNEAQTAYSNILIVNTLPLLAPVDLQAAVINERDITFQFKDDSTAESGFEFEYRLAGSEEWSYLFRIPARPGSLINELTITGFDPASEYEFRLRAFVGPFDDPEQYSDYSNTARAITFFSSPANLEAEALDDSRIALTWQDNSQVEQGFGVYVKEAGAGDFVFIGFAAGNATSFIVSGLDAGVEYDFQVTTAYAASLPPPRDEIVESAPSNSATARVKDRLTSAVYVEFVKGVLGMHLLTTTTGATLVASSVTGLPNGLEYDAAMLSVTGIPSEVVVREAEVRLEFSDGWIKETTITFRVLSPPNASEVLPDVTLLPNHSFSLALGGFFGDPDVDSALEITTSLGSMRWALYDQITPLTVSNLMAYVSAGDYTNTVFHRNVPGFVLQGGAFRPDPVTGPNAFTVVPTRPQVPNEPMLSAVRGTLSMAKLGGEPNSATNQFFINLNNNGPILNNQNGGFTVFGRVVNADMSVADAMAALPTGDYEVLFDGAPAFMEDWPLQGQSQSMDNSLSVLIEGITSVPVLVYEVFTNSNPTVASAVITGEELSILALIPGEAVVGIRAIDLDGLVLEQSLTVTVTKLSYAQWAFENIPDGASGPLEDADAGGLRNLEEFAFMGIATNSVDDASLAPLFTLSPSVNGARTWSASFNLRKFADIRYTVWVSSDVEDAAWQQLWSDLDDGMASPSIEHLEDLGTHYRVRLSDTLQAPSASQRHIGLRIDLP